jgi:LCP family protein required for cell wall assembly
MPESGEIGGASWRPRPGPPLPPLPPELDPHRRHRRHRAPGTRSDARRNAMIAMKAALTLLSIAVLVAFGYGWSTYGGFNSDVPRLNVFGSGGNKQKNDIDGKDQNILVVGNDDRSSATDAELAQLGTTRDGGSLNTDTMMIIHVPANGEKATLISLPRDSYVAIPGHGNGKLNSAYPDAYSATSGSIDAKRTAGAALLVTTVQNLTGLKLDHFVQVDLLGFYRISNAIGGVTVNMCNAVQESNSGINLKKGLNVVKGTQALAFVRQRYGFPNGLGDLDRVQRQQYFLTAAFRKVASAGILLNPFKLKNLLSAVSSSLYVDSSLDLLNLARQMENLTADNIVGKTIPSDGFGTSPDGQSIVVVNPTEVKTFVSRLIGNLDSTMTKAKIVAPAQVTVDVLNGGTEDGAAKTNADLLGAQGFHIGTVSSGSSTSSTVIKYSSGQESQAKTLALYVPGATFQRVSGLAHVTLLLGADGLKVVVPKKPTTSPSTHPSSTTKTTPKATPTVKPTAIDSTCIN